MGVLQFQTEQKINMMKEVVALSLFVFLFSTVESTKPIKKVLSIVKDIKENMLTKDDGLVTLDEMEEIKDQIVDEVYNSLAPVIKNSCSCCDGPPSKDCEEQGVFAAGGIGDYGASLPLIYNPITNMQCELPQQNQVRYRSSTTGYISCGGYDYNWYGYSTVSSIFTSADYNCEIFDPCTGTWSFYKEWESEGYPPRAGHVAWMSSIGLFLIGGYGAEDSSMLIGNDGTLSTGMINSGRAGACEVADPRNDRVIIIGGSGSSAVDIYYIDGSVQPLPSLNSDRIWAGCSGYYDEFDNFVLIVTGGSPGETETLVVDVDTAWNYDPNCYNPWDFNCADANNEIYCLQGYYSYEIEEYNKMTGCFDFKAHTNDSRGYFGNFASNVCLVPGCNPFDWCVNSEIMKKPEPLDHSKPIPGQNEEDRIVLPTK